MSPLSMKTFNWSSESVGKTEYHEFDSTLKANLGTSKVAYCYSAEDTNPHRPGTIMNPPPNNATFETKLSYEKHKHSHQNKIQSFFKDFDNALGILRSLFTYGSKALSDIDVAMARPQNVPEDDWNSERKFRAAMEAIKQYAPRNVTDVTELRKLIIQLDDTDGFHEYRAKFTEYHSQLVAAQSIPTDNEMTEWVKQSIKNMNVKNYLAGQIDGGAQNITPWFIFQKIQHYLTFVGSDGDPYKKVTSKIVPSSPVSANVAKTDGTTSRCTRCWRTNHSWKTCKASTCSICGTSMIGKDFCPSYLTHQEKGTNWIPRHLKKKTDQEPVSSPKQDDEGKARIKEARKALNALIKEEKAKRQK